MSSLSVGANYCSPSLESRWWYSHCLLQTTSILSVWEESIFISSVSTITHKTIPKYQLNTYKSINDYACKSVLSTGICWAHSWVLSPCISWSLGKQAGQMTSPISKMMKPASGWPTQADNVSVQIPDPGFSHCFSTWGWVRALVLTRSAEKESWNQMTNGFNTVDCYGVA